MKMGVDFCMPKSGYQSQEEPLFSPECVFTLWVDVCIIHMLRRQSEQY